MAYEKKRTGKDGANRQGNRKPYRGNPGKPGFNRAGAPKRPAPVEKRDVRPENPEKEINENMVVGRNAVRELLASGRDIDKIYVQKGEREGSIIQLIGEAAARKLPIAALFQ